MRKVFLLAALVLACAKKEAPPADTATPAPPPPPPPAALTPAAVAGSWNGVSHRDGDTTSITWTLTSTSDSTGKLVFAQNKQTVDYAVKFDADSMIATSKPYNDPSAPKGTPKVTFHSIGHLKDGKFGGIAHIMLASKPDSMVSKVTWEATKAP
jgi:hypothetical protein